MTVTYPKKIRNAYGARDFMPMVVRDRELHLLTLNRYRYSEQRSCLDITSTIEQLNGKPRELVRDLSHHVADEARHAMWLTDLLYEIDGDLGEPSGVSYIDEFERLLDSNKFSAEENFEDAVIAVLAAINVTEKRGCETFSAHIKALKETEQTPENVKIRATIERIFPEEAAHVRWGNRWLAETAKKSPEHRKKVDNAKRKYAAIEQAAFEAGADITFGAELRRLEKLLEVASTMPLWERPQYLAERLPETLVDPNLQATRWQVAQKAWNRDPKAFVEKFVPMFFSDVSAPPAKKKLASQN